MWKFSYLLFVLKRSYICYYMICTTVPLCKITEYLSCVSRTYLLGIIDCMLLSRYVRVLSKSSPWNYLSANKLATKRAKRKENFERAILHDCHGSRSSESISGANVNFRDWAKTKLSNAINESNVKPCLTFFRDFMLTSFYNEFSVSTDVIYLCGKIRIRKSRHYGGLAM